MPDTVKEMRHLPFCLHWHQPPLYYWVCSFKNTKHFISLFFLTTRASACELSAVHLTQRMETARIFGMVPDKQNNRCFVDVKQRDHPSHKYLITHVNAFVLTDIIFTISQYTCKDYYEFAQHFYINMYMNNS